MALGPGKYDDACTAARLLTQARIVVLIVIEGNRGQGFSCQIENGGPEDARKLAALLHDVANQIGAQ